MPKVLSIIHLQKTIAFLNQLWIYIINGENKLNVNLNSSTFGSITFR